MSKKHKYWKSEAHRNRIADFVKNELHREFKENASELMVSDGDEKSKDTFATKKDASATKKDFFGDLFDEGSKSKNGGLSVTRRDFLKTMGASVALAGLSGCGYIRKPVQKIYPYANMPEHIVPGKPLYYGTGMSRGDDVVGLVVESHEGRPVKIEGNPLCPQSSGKTDHFQQASILDLYDPDRLKSFVSGEKQTNASALKKWFASSANDLKNENGDGLAIVYSHEPSPTFYRLLDALKSNYSDLRTYRIDSVSNQSVIEGVEKISGESALPLINFEKADVVLSLGSDFLSMEYDNLTSTREFSRRRDPENSKMNRLYVYENSFTVTGGRADHRFRVKRQDLSLVLYAIIDELYSQGFKGIDRAISSFIGDIKQVFVTRLGGSKAIKHMPAVAKDLIRNAGRSVLVAGRDMSPLVHTLVFYINFLLRAPISYRSIPLGDNAGASVLSQMEALFSDLQTKKIKRMAFLSDDLLSVAPVDMDFHPLIKGVDSVCLSSHKTEMAKNCSLAVPKSHYLERWGDLLNVRGDLVFQQPLIAPMYLDSYSEIAFLYELSTLAEGGKVDFSNRQSLERQAVKDTHGFNERTWRAALHDGVKKDHLETFISPNVESLSWVRDLPSEVGSAGELELVFEVDYSLYDGRYANNAWLQELPDPISKMTWDNMVTISYGVAKRLGVKNQDVVEVNSGEFESRRTSMGYAGSSGR